MQNEVGSLCCIDAKLMSFLLWPVFLLDLDVLNVIIARVCVFFFVYMYVLVLITFAYVCVLFIFCSCIDNFRFFFSFLSVGMSWILSSLSS